MSPIDFIFILFFTVTAALGSYFYKLAADRLKTSILSNWFIYFGVFVYFASNIFFILALKDNPLSLVFAFSGLVYVWTLLIGWRMLGEQITKRKFVATALIILGVAIINFG